MTPPGDRAHLAVRLDVRPHPANALPVAAVLALGLVVAVARRTELDLVSLDDDTPGLPGLRLGPARPGFLAPAVLLAATAVAAAGTIGFVGLVAPHAARSLVGRRTCGSCRSRCCWGRRRCAWRTCSAAR